MNCRATSEGEATRRSTGGRTGPGRFTMIHLQKSVAWLCIGLVVFVAVTSTAAGEIAALLAPLWLLCVDLAARLRPARRRAPRRASPRAARARSVPRASRAIRPRAVAVVLTAGEPVPPRGGGSLRYG